MWSMIAQAQPALPCLHVCAAHTECGHLHDQVGPDDNSLPHLNKLEHFVHATFNLQYVQV